MSYRKTKKQVYNQCKSRFWSTQRRIPNKSDSAILQNCKGSVSLVGLSLVLMVTSYFLTVILNKKQLNREAQARSEVYLCAKKGLSLENKYLKRMNHFNQGIEASFYLMNSPIPKVAQVAKLTHSSLKLAQQVFHVSHLKQISLIANCQLENRAQWFIHQVYSSGPLLIRSKTGQAKQKVKECHYYFFPNTKLMRPSMLFTLKIKREVLQDHFEWQSKEVSLNLRPSSGY